MRLFVGLPWPGLSDLSTRAKVWNNRPALRIVAPENWHVTLRFLGDHPEEVVPQLASFVEDWAKKQRPLTFVDRGWSCFGSYVAPRVVILQLEAMPDVTKATATLLKILDNAGFPGDQKPWKPHITMAYGSGGDPGPWPDEAKGGRPSVVFQRVVLYESTLGPNGSTFRECASATLG